MSRRSINIVRVINEDFVYNSVLVTKFINYLMYNGKKRKAERIFYSALFIIKYRLSFDNNFNVLDVLKTAVKHSSPSVEVRSRRVGGATYQIPIIISISRSLSFGVRWIIEAARQRFGCSMDIKLADEIIDAANTSMYTGKCVGIGGAIKKKENVHRMAEANKVFSHYNW